MSRCQAHAIAFLETLRVLAALLDMRSTPRWLPALTFVVLLCVSCRLGPESQAGVPATDGPFSEQDTTATTVEEIPPISIVVTTPSRDDRTPGASRSFVSTDRIALKSEDAETVWKLDGELSDGTIEPSSHSGPIYEIALRPKNVSGSRSRPLKYAVLASVGDRVAPFVLEQDPIDTIRQQYIDLSKRRTPSRGEFLSGGQSRRGYFRFAEIQSRDGAPWAVFTALDRLDEWRENYGGSLRVNRGYSTPRHNAKIKGAAKNSQHLYGTAADVDSDAADWHAKRDAARDAGACLEPLAISGYGHVHGDWREQCPPGW